MKLPDRIASLVVIFAGSMTLGGCSIQAQEPIRGPDIPVVANGPAADYPIVIGEPFEVDGVTYKPLDTMNYDRVGYAMAEVAGASGVTGAHRTLPLPSYVEVTALDTGRTILVRLERRGPMVNDRLVALAPDAMAQLAIVEGAPIRIRRVNPPEKHRAMLRAGEDAPLRMDTPDGLLVVLRKRLPDAGSASLTDPRQAHVSGLKPSEAQIVSIDPSPKPKPEPEVEQGSDTVPEPEPHQDPQRGLAKSEGQFAVQLGAFAVRGNAEKLAARVGGFLVESGRFTIVRTGPYPSRGQAADALAKLRAQGYSDAQIRKLD